MSIFWGKRLPTEKEVKEAFMAQDIGCLKNWTKPEMIPMVEMKQKQPVIMPDRVVMGRLIVGYTIFKADIVAWKITPPEGRLVELAKHLHRSGNHLAVKEIFHRITVLVALIVH